MILTLALIGKESCEKIKFFVFVALIDSLNKLEIKFLIVQ